MCWFSCSFSWRRIIYMSTRFCSWLLHVLVNSDSRKKISISNRFVFDLEVTSRLFLLCLFLNLSNSLQIQAKIKQRQHVNNTLLELPYSYSVNIKGFHSFQHNPRVKWCFTHTLWMSDLKKSNKFIIQKLNWNGRG